ncbi:hypothetical protein [Lacicoccus qingdaonensis]|uniref:Uncharacterized protein n=1 Tax=Lacicoccus qingdaonensis TaxID=576118 RepID=A0A1G9AE83_9BACL|nr:hypothetical protein [Salinicoccus qingdaonensis]SDK25581.1 hypothetical protein SAMN05216216_101227 [Salinicoccus qingdaonensis]
MLKEIKGFSLLFLAVVMIGTIYIYSSNNGKNAYSDNIYTQEVHNETMAIEQDTNAIDEIIEEKILSTEESDSDLKSVTMGK